MFLRLPKKVFAKVTRSRQRIKAQLKPKKEEVKQGTKVEQINAANNDEQEKKEAVNSTKTDKINRKLRKQEQKEFLKYLEKKVFRHERFLMLQKEEIQNIQNNIL